MHAHTHTHPRRETWIQVRPAVSGISHLDRKRHVSSPTPTPQLRPSLVLSSFLQEFVELLCEGILVCATGVTD